MSDVQIQDKGLVSMVLMSRPPANYFDRDMLAGIADAVVPLGNPPLCQLLGGFRICVGGQVFFACGTVVTGIGDHVHAGCVRQPFEQMGVTTDPFRRAIHERVYTVATRIHEIGEHGGKHIILVVTLGANLIRTDEIDQNVLMGQHRPELVDGNGAVDGHHLGGGAKEPTRRSNTRQR